MPPMRSNGKPPSLAMLGRFLSTDWQSRWYEFNENMNKFIKPIQEKALSTMKIYEFTALSIFASLLINCDGSGLSFKDGLRLDRFCDNNHYRLDLGHFSCPTEDNEPHFAMCEVLGVMGECITFQFLSKEQ